MTHSQSNTILVGFLFLIGIVGFLFWSIRYERETLRIEKEFDAYIECVQHQYNNEDYICVKPKHLIEWENKHGK